MSLLDRKVHTMSILDDLNQAEIQVVVTLIGRGDIFHRIVDEIRRVNQQHPGLTGPEKRARFLADCEVVFTDLVIPLLEAELRILLEFGIRYLMAQSQFSN